MLRRAIGFGERVQLGYQRAIASRFWPDVPDSGSRVALLWLALFALVMRIPSLLAPRTIDDESVYAVVAGELAHGGLPYVSAIERKPPLLFWIYQVPFSLPGDHAVLALHGLAVLWVLATMWFLFLAGRELTAADGGIAAAGLYALFSTALVPRNLAFNGELMMNLPLAWAAYLMFRRQRSVTDVMLAGALCAAACLIKQPAAIAALGFGLYLLSADARASRGQSFLRACLEGLALSVGFALVLAGVALHLRSLGVLREAYYWSVGDHDVPHGPLDVVFWQRGALIFGWCAAGLALTLLNVRAFIASRDYWRERSDYRGLVLLLVCSLIGTAASGRFYPHYFLQLLLPQVLLAGPVLARLWRGERGAPSWLFRARSFQWLLVLTSAAYFVINLVALWPTPLQDDVADYVRAHSTTQQKIFVWGQSSRTYLDAERRPASRFINTFPLTGYLFGSPHSRDPDYDTSRRILPGAWDTLAADLARTPPSFIVDSEGALTRPRYPMQNFPVLESLLDEHYHSTFRGTKGVVYARN